jgi:hypothetical protein
MRGDKSQDVCDMYVEGRGSSESKIKINMLVMVGSKIGEVQSYRFHCRYMR